jgi:hypothetical protein
MKKVSKFAFGDSVEFWVEDEEHGEYFILSESELPTATELEIMAQNSYLLGLIARVGKKLHAVSEATINIFFHAANHSMPYAGPNYEKELREMDKVVKTFHVPEEVGE